VSFAPFALWTQVVTVMAATPWRLQLSFAGVVGGLEGSVLLTVLFPSVLGMMWSPVWDVRSCKGCWVASVPSELPFDSVLRILYGHSVACWFESRVSVLVVVWLFRHGLPSFLFFARLRAVQIVRRFVSSVRSTKLSIQRDWIAWVQD
jgi:hypothetical protein